MSKATQNDSTVRQTAPAAKTLAKNGRRVATPASAAKLSFEAMRLDLKADLLPRAAFLEQSSIAYAGLVVGMGMLTKSPAELTAALKAMTDAENDGGECIFETLKGLHEAKEWFSGFAKVLGVIEARALIAASRLVEGV